MTKPGRNQPCPCGSGRKYKQCCLPKGEFAAPPASASSIDQLLHQATRHHQQGQMRRAEQLCQQALRLDPHHAGALHLSGILAYQAGDFGVAAAAFREAIEHHPQVADFHSNLGLTRRWLGDLEGAILSFREALRLRPDAAVVHNNLGNALRDHGELPEAIEQYGEALALDPDHADAHVNLMQVSQQLCDWSNLDKLWNRTKEMIRSEASYAMRPAAAMTIDTSPEEQLLCARKWVRHRLAPIAGLRESLDFRFQEVSQGAGPQEDGADEGAEGRDGNRLPREESDAGSGSRLRVGYLSADFRAHPIAYLIAELFELHDRDRFEIFAYSIAADDGSDIRQRIVQGVDRWVDLEPLSHPAAARQIYRDGIDILVDLNGHTKGARTEILALRPAPIQINYQGYPGTMGAPFIDYIITDPFLTPPDQQQFFDEDLMYLPDSYQVNDRRRPVADRTPSRSECGLPEEGFVYCSFNNSYKITPIVFDVWMRLLLQTPGSVLWLSQANQWVVENLRREAGTRGVDPARLVFAPKLPSLADHLARQRQADLFLDTRPYNAHTTASDALWVGLPVLTCPGETFASRVAGSLLTAIGLPELIASSLEEYEQTALRLASHPMELGSLRRKLRANREDFPLFDTPRYTRNLEARYQQAWERCANRSGG